MLLYPIVDVEACAAKGVQPVQLSIWLHAAGITMLQLRAKGWDAARVLALVQEVQRSVPPQACRIILNDRADLAALSQCYGIHVGQSDLPVPVVRRVAPGLHVGISTHSLEQVNVALADAPDYVAIGPVFETMSKQNPEPSVGVDCLRQAQVLCAQQHVPLVAIGGINAETVELVRPYCDYVAVIGAITHADERSVNAAVRSLLG